MKPYVHVVSATVARWLKNVMSAAGVDTTSFKPHSARSAGTSKAAAQGFSIKDILDLANWSRATTFRKFYQKPVATVHKDFESAVFAL